MLEIKNLSFSYNAKDFIFKDLNFSCSNGCFALTGPNGSGKTTLIRIISRLAVPLYGGLVDGDIIFNGKKDFIPSVVLQNNDSQILCETAYDEVSFFSLNRNFIFKNPSDFFKHWNIEKIKDIRTDFLSYGEKQKYAISLCLSFSNRANLILMDEPLAFLDENNINSFREILKDLKKNNTVLIFGHRFDEISSVIDDYFVIKDKKISKLDSFTYHKKLILKNDTFSNSIFIKADNIVSKFIRKKINFEIRKGEMKIIYGPNGSGKTTFVKIISGMINEFDGQIYVEDIKTSRKELLKNIFPILANPDTQIIARKISDIFKNSNSKWIDLIKKLGLYEKRDYYISHLSYGEKQKFLIAYAVASDKKMIIIDEPFLSFDINTEYAVFNLIKDYLTKGGVVLFSTHRKDIFNIVDCDIIEL